MPFSTRPHFEDRQIVQYGEDVINLSGQTRIAPTILDFSGATTGETTVTINGLTGYLNVDEFGNPQRLSGLVVEPAQLKISGSTGTTTQNVTGFVLQSIDPYGSVEWGPISGVSWSVSACTSPLYVSTIEACPNPTDPIYITAGNVQFGAAPSLIADITNTRLGIGTGSPSKALDIQNGDLWVENSDGKFETQLTDTSGPLVRLTGDSSSLTRIIVASPPDGGITIGHRGLTEAGFPGYGKQGDGFLYSSIDENGLNIISQPGSGTEDYIRFYAGDDANGATANLYIQGSGSTKGNIGINNESPTEKLHIISAVEANIKVEADTGNVDETDNANILLTQDGGISTARFGMSPDGDNHLLIGVNSTTVPSIKFATRSDGTSFSTTADTKVTISNAGNVGIGTETPTEKLHVEGSVRIVDGTEQTGYVLTCDANGVGSWQFNSTGFSGNTSGTCITDLYITNLYGCSPVTVHDSLQHVTSSGTGVNSIAWGEGALASGDYSHAQGGSGTASGTFHRVTASGEVSYAQGYSLASGLASHAEGGYDGKNIRPTSATTASAHAEGAGTLASADMSHAEGIDTIASGIASHAEGSGTLASGGSSHAEGIDTNANGGNSHAEGDSTTASGTTSHAEGFGTVAGGTYSHAEGNTARASGQQSHAEGFETLASGLSSHAEGSGSLASGSASHAEGQSTEATGTTAHSEGQNTVAGGDWSHAGGFQSKALGDASYARGVNALAYGGGSNALGGNVIAYGLYSFVGGQSSISSGDTSFVYSKGSTLTANNSAILGGEGIDGTTDDTVYVPNLTVRNDHILHSDSVLEVSDLPGSLESEMKGSFSEFNWSGVTTNLLSNNNPSGSTSFLLGNFTSYPTVLNHGFLSYYGTGYTRTGTPATGNEFYRNKMVLKTASGSAGTIFSNANSAGEWQWESDGNSRMVLTNNGELGLGLNLNGTQNPSEMLHVNEGDILVTNTNGQFYTDIQNSAGPLTLLSGSSTELPRFGVKVPTYDSLVFGVRGGSEPTAGGYGKQGDAFIYSSIDNNGFNIVSQPGTGTDDYVRFFVGQAAGAAGTPDLYIQGSGTTRGNVGINNETPTSKLDILGTNGYQQLRLRTNYTPTSTADTNGEIGDIAWDNSYLYIKTGTGWGRLALDYVF